MAGLFALLFIFALLGLILGLIAPKLYTKLFRGHSSRKKVSLWFGVATVVLFIVYAITAASVPTPLTVNNLSGNTASTDNATYTLTGIAPANAVVTVDGKTATRNGDSFSIPLNLKEGDNPVTVKAVNGSETDEQHITIHRTTTAELKARDDAQQAADAQKAKAEADAKAKAAAAHAEARTAILNKMSGIHDQLVSDWADCQGSGFDCMAGAASNAVKNANSLYEANPSFFTGKAADDFQGWKMNVGQTEGDIKQYSINANYNKSNDFLAPVIPREIQNDQDYITQLSTE